MSTPKPGGPPKDKAEYSSNWKKLLSTIGPTTQKRKSEDLQKDHKHKRLKEGTVSDKEVKHLGSTDKDRKQKETGNRSGTDREVKTGKVQTGNGVKSSRKEALVLDSALTHPTKALAMDCEMVGVGKDGVESVLARVSLVNQHGHCVYDKFVRPREKVTDFRTHVSGVRASDLWKAEEFLVVQREVSDLLKGRVLVGHALHNDLKVLFLDHPNKNIRDSSRYKLFRQLSGSGRPSLKKLSAKILGVEVQQGEHNSVQDAQAAMGLYMMYRKRWETDLYNSGMKKTTSSKKKKKKTENSKKVHFESGT
ncbi:uncharacterized protein [Littorina saxatilis]|uniref:RNA exonuclease 4 n=2 Tax=Littorina saxatilis TaxID=31220 RepID=A0AAN9BAG8_9CAEN